MKKKIFCYILAICMLVLCGSVQAAVSGDYEYEVQNNTAIITDYTGKSNKLVIPSTLGGYKVTAIDDYAFDSSNNTTNITIPNTVTSIGSYAFMSCSNLTTVTIPNSVKTIGEGAFKWDYALTSITLPSGLTKIEDSVFNNCYGLKSVTIPNGVTEIAGWAFSNCSALTTIKLPTTLKKIGDYAFEYCQNLTSITIPVGTTSIGYEAFAFCEKLTKLTVPNTVTTIGEYAFRNCSGMTSITLSSSLTEIPNYAFYNCESLKSVTVPNNVTRIGRDVFFGCDALTTVVLPSKLKVIDYGAFEYCNNIKNIVIPAGVEEMDSYVFSGWKDDQSIFFIASEAGNEWMLSWNANCNAKIYWGTAPFVDVKPTDWFFKSVKYCNAKGIINGTGVQKFSPNAKLTRGMIVTILYGMEGSPKVTSANRFSDVSSSKYYYRAVLWASSKSIVNGSNGKFRPEDNITRQDLAVILMAYSRYKKKYVASNVSLAGFSDYKNVASYAQPAMKWATKNRVINGSNGKLNPKGTATRAEAATMIYNYIQKFGR